jgi:hypothetical protein
MRGNGSLTGHYEKNGVDTDLPWNYTFNLNSNYVVRIVQDGSNIHVFLDNTRLSPSIPCSSIGPTVGLYAGASPQNHIEGSFDYIEIWP